MSRSLFARLSLTRNLACKKIGEVGKFDAKKRPCCCACGLLFGLLQKWDQKMASWVKLFHSQFSPHDFTSLGFQTYLVADTLVDCHHQLLQLVVFRLSDHQANLLVVYSWCLWCPSSSDFTRGRSSHYRSISLEEFGWIFRSSMYRWPLEASPSQMGNNHRFTFIGHKTCRILLCCHLHMFDVR